MADHAVDPNAGTRKFAEMLVHHRSAVMVLLVLFTAPLAYFMCTQLSLRVVLEEMVPPNHPYVKVHNKFSPVFGGVNTSIFSMRVTKGTIYTKDFLAKFKAFTDEIYFYKDTDRFSVQSIALKKTKEISGEAGAIRIESLMWPDLPETQEQLEHLREAARGLYGGLYVSLDDKSAVVIADFKSNVKFKDLYNFTRALKAKYETDDVKLDIIGRPVLLGWIEHYMTEMTIIFAVSTLLIAAVCYFYYRSLMGVMVPLLKAALTTIWGLGFISLAHYNVNPLMLLLPFFVFATILSHAVQIMSRFYEEYAVLGDFDKALIETLAALLKPSFSAIITDALGFSVLYLARIPTLQILAILCTVWLLSITVAITFSAAAFFVMPMPEKLKMHGRSTLNFFTAKLVTYRYARNTMIACGIILVVSWYFSTKVKVGDTEPGSPILWPTSEYNLATEHINNSFVNLGSDTIQVYVQGSEATMQSPAVYKMTEGLQRYVQERIPEVGGVQTLVPMVKATNGVLNEGDPSYQYIPATPEGVASTLYFFRSRGEPNDFRSFVDTDFKNGNLTFYLKDHKHDTLEKVTATIKEYISLTGATEGMKFYYPGGAGGLTLATNEEIHRSDFVTLASIIAAISVTMYLTYRSLAAVVLVLGMLLMADYLSLTYMYFMGMGLNLDTLPIAAVGMGRGVDYGIYIIDRIKEEYAKCRNAEEACRRAVDSTGTAIIFTALTMVVPLVPWYFVSSLRFQGQMGILLAMILFWHAVGALIYLTAGICYFKPKSILVAEGEPEGATSVENAVAVATRS